jgi:hypothetical protein
MDGQSLSYPVSLKDLTPIILHWLGFPDDEIPGPAADLVDQLFANDEKTPDRPLFSSSTAFGPPQYSLLWGKWKAVLKTQPSSLQLFDLATDPLEKAPVRDPELEREMREMIEAHLSGKSNAPLFPELNQEQIRRLRSLGYLGGVEEK